jgi:twitching motility two-component system response regulator PilH
MQKFKLRNLFNRNTSQRERRQKPRPGNQQGSAILVVDDSRTIQFTLKKILEQDGYTVLIAGDGTEAIDMAKSHDPDLILMDVIMPGINGFRATRLLNNDEQTADIPIIMMSADEQAMQEFWINKIGAKDFLNKPFVRGELFQKVEKFVRVKMVA